MEKNQRTDDTQATKVFKGVDATTSVRLRAISTANSKLDICDDAYGTVALVQLEKIKDAIIEAVRKRHVRARFITEITRENLPSCKQLMKHVELRHIDGVKGNFAVTEKLYYAFAPLKEASILTETVLSNVKTIVELHQYLFDVLWQKAIPAIQRIRELEEGVVPVETKIISSKDSIARTIDSFIRRAAAPRDSHHDSFIFAVTDMKTPQEPEQSQSLFRELKERNPHFRALLITDIQESNLQYVKKQLELGVEIRHIDRNRISFAVSKDEYLSSSPDSMEDSRAQSGLPSEVIWSNNPDVVSQAVQIFEMLWATAITAEQRIRQIEEGIVELGETRVIKNVAESALLAETLIAETKREVLIILASDKTIRRNLEIYGELIKAAKQRGFQIRVLAPIDPSDSAAELLRDVEWRSAEPMNVGIAIYDRSKMLITQYVDATAPSWEEAFISNIYIANSQTIAGMVSVFEALWRESELRRREMLTREREVKARRQAQLLQDILTHDIRNYNQVSRLTAELMKEEAQGNRSLEELAESLLASIDGSTMLVDRAKSLGRIVSEENPKLRPVDLNSFLDASIDLIREAFPKKQINVAKFTKSSNGEVRAVHDFEEVTVLADDLLSEVFSNIFSNSVKYTNSNFVDIELRVSENNQPGEEKIEEGSVLVAGQEPLNDDRQNVSELMKQRPGNKYVKVSITDKGRGIPEELRSILFNRYLVGARGSGLGLSIVHALVVDRYKGGVSISNKPGAEGTVVNIWLLKATAN
ncbi:MAG TPA: HAMP domain-containing sensor histidine kinase [Nitrososphaerales archaeon]|nr:HAMP domain-containing sensor histidine kinase [Nitrososphaerales archaeon]